MNGIKKETAKRLLSVDLRSVGVPIRIVEDVSGYGGASEAGRVGKGMEQHRNWAFSATLDEAGRVRVLSDWGGSSGDEHGGTEAQEMASAEAVVDHILSRTLAAWGIKDIGTNEA